MGYKYLDVNLETQKTDKGLRIFLQTSKKAAVIVTEGEKERILLPLDEEPSENTYYYENSSGLAKTEKGYVGFYSGSPDSVKVLN